MKIYTKEELIEELRKIKATGWIENTRPRNAGAVGNTLEDLLGVKENNLPIPNASEWELKTQRLGTSSLTTLFHTEPSPRALRIVPNILLPLYGWQHRLAGTRYPKGEKSFRQTINDLLRTDRGFGITIDKHNRKVSVSFDASTVLERHREWLQSVEKRTGLGELNPQPYWGFDDLFHIFGTKLVNCFYVKARTKREKGKEYFYYEKILILEKLDLDRIISAIESGLILIDFDARTGHNHGTKFRMRQDSLPALYAKVTAIED